MQLWLRVLYFHRTRSFNQWERVLSVLETNLYRPKAVPPCYVLFRSIEVNFAFNEFQRAQIFATGKTHLFHIDLQWILLNIYMYSFSPHRHKIRHFRTCDQHIHQFLWTKIGYYMLKNTTVKKNKFLMPPCEISWSFFAESFFCHSFQFLWFSSLL